MRTDEYPLTAAPLAGGEIPFILSLAQALHRYGAPAHRLEAALSVAARVLGMQARFFSTPTTLIASFGPPEEMRTSLMRMEPGEMDLARLGSLDRLAGEVIRRKKTPEEGAREIERILARPQPYGAVISVLCFALAGGAGARLFGGGLAEIVAAAISSLLVGILEQFSDRPALGRVRTPVAGFIAAAVSVVVAHLVPMSPRIATLGGLFVLLPGLGLTVAMTELGTRQLMSGTSRLMGAAVALLQLVFGVALATRLGALLPALPHVPTVPTPGTELVALLLLALAAIVLLRADAEDAPWILLAGAVAYLGARLGSQMLGTELGAFLGAVVLGMVSNLLAHLRDRPSVITIVPGLLLLVPGSIGFRGLESFLIKDVVAGMDTLFWMMMVAVSLCAGLLVGNVLAPQRKVL